MKENFDKKLKDLMDSSLPEDMGFELNKDAIWNKIENKKEPKVIPFKRWITHAAAVIVGILLCLPFLFRSNTETTKPIVFEKATPSNPIIIRDTVFVNNLPAPEQKTGLPIRTAERTKKVTTQPEKIAQQPILAVVKPEDKPQKPIERLLVKNQPIASRPKALHVKDMNNENATRSSIPYDKPGFIERLALRDAKETPTETISATITQHLITSNY